MVYPTFQESCFSFDFQLFSATSKSRDWDGIQIEMWDEKLKQKMALDGTVSDEPEDWKQMKVKIPLINQPVRVSYFLSTLTIINSKSKFYNENFIFIILQSDNLLNTKLFS